MSDSFQITYAAHTATCTFLLDSEGICRRVILANSKRTLHPSAREAARAAARCVGAQYVASLDPSVAGLLAEMPRVGAAMLFARLDERGRVSLVRTGLITQFERPRAEDPFEERATSPSVETSAPVITPSAPTPRRSRATSLPPGRDLYADESHDRTQPVQALRAKDFRNLHREIMGEDDDATLERTKAYPLEGGRPTWPSAHVDPNAPAAPTLRNPSAPSPAAAEDDEDPTMAPRLVRTEPAAHPRARTVQPPARMRSDRVPRTPDPARPSPAIEKIVVRRRGER